jgi:hypothetical protein
VGDSARVLRKSHGLVTGCASQPQCPCPPSRGAQLGTGVSRHHQPHSLRACVPQSRVAPGTPASSSAEWGHGPVPFPRGPSCEICTQFLNPRSWASSFPVRKPVRFTDDLLTTGPSTERRRGSPHPPPGPSIRPHTAAPPTPTSSHRRPPSHPTPAGDERPHWPSRFPSCLSSVWDLIPGLTLDLVICW